MSKKVAVITGSADGLGKGIAERLAADGFRIVLSDINAGQLAATEQEFKRNGHEVTSFVGNVARRDDQFALVAHAVATFGQVNVFINNAGIEDVMPLDAVREPDLEKVFSVNVYSVVYGTQAAAEQMKKQGTGGKIINACSIAGHESVEFLSVYCATKHAVRSLTQSAAKELAQRRKITVNAYCPGVAATKMWDRIDEEMGKYLGTERGEAFERFSSGILLGPARKRPRTWPIWFTTWPRPIRNYMTGQSIMIDGGIVLRWLPLNCSGWTRVLLAEAHRPSANTSAPGSAMPRPVLRLAHQGDSKPSGWGSPCMGAAGTRPCSAAGAAAWTTTGSIQPDLRSRHRSRRAELRQHQEESEPLIRIARSGLERLYQQLKGLDYVLLLADRHGVAVDFLGRDADTGDLRRAGPITWAPNGARTVPALVPWAPAWPPATP